MLHCTMSMPCAAPTESIHIVQCSMKGRAMIETVFEQELPAALTPKAAETITKRSISPAMLSKAALRIGARQTESDLGLALASLGLVLAGLRRAPLPVTLPDLASLEALIPAVQQAHAEAILATARGIVDGLAAEEDAVLAAAPAAGCA
jgi:hypothetical protein